MALLIALFGWFNAARDKSLGDVYDGVEAFRADIEIACADMSTDEGRDECADMLRDFNQALYDYRDIIRDLNEADATSTATST